MAALICAMAMGDAHSGLDAMLLWKPPVLITRIMREVSKSLPIPSLERTEGYVQFHHESFYE
ncbi:hypothetical protein L345_10460, partial [Ophiophagus hannah]